MSKWQGFTATVPPGLSEAATGMASALSASRTALEVLRQTTRTALAMAQSPQEPTTTAANLAIQAVLSALRNLIQSILDDAGIYVLMIPLPKKGIGELLTANPNDDPGSTEVRFPTGRIDAPAKASRVYDQLMNPTRLFLGGNAHYTRTVAESFFDAGDLNRPTFERNDRWSYCAILAGAEDLGAALTLGGAFERIFGTDPQSPIGRGEDNLVPTGVTGTVSPRGFRPVLRWDLVNISRVLQSLGRSSSTVTRFAVIRAKDWRVRTTSRVEDLFGTNELTVNQSGKYQSEVVAIVDYDGLTTQWTGTEELVEGATNYYTVAFETRYNAEVGVDPQEESKSLGFKSFASPVEIVRRTNAPPRRTKGQRPDWNRTGSLAQTFPAIASLLDLVTARLDELGRRSSNFNALNDQYLEFLNGQIQRYADKADDMVRAATAITNLVSAFTTLAGAHVRVASGQGSAQSVVSDLMTSFEGDDDQPVGQQPPPYVMGTEYTCGVFLLGVGSDVSGLEALFNTLFRSTESDPILEGIASIPTLVTRVEEAALADLAPAEEPGSEGFDEGMVPRDDGTDAGCDPAETTTPVFNDSMEPV